MGISTNFILIFLLAALLAYISFLLWKPLKVSEPSSKLICFFLALAFSVFLGLVYLLGFTLGGTAFSLMMFGHTISYILAGICSVLLCAYTIKILPSKIGNGTAFHCFCNISFVVFLVLGIGEIATAHSSNFVLSTLPNAVFDNTVLGISNIGVALCAACIRPSKKVSPAVPEASPSPAQVSMPVETPSADTSDSEQNDPPAVKNAPDPDVPLCVPAAQSQKDSVSTKAVIHFSVSKKVLLVVAFIIVLMIGILTGLFLGEGYFAPHFTPSSPYIDSLKAAEKSAASTAYSNGYKSGYASGQIDGYNSASEASRDAYSEAWLNGWDGGYNSGYEEGYNAGYDDGYYAY